MNVQGNKWIKPVILAVVLVSAGGLGVAAATSGDFGRGHCAGRGHGAGLFGPGRHLDGKLAFLKTELKIRADQEPAWQAFADVVRARAAERAAQWQARREGRGQMRPDKEEASKARDAPALNERIDRGIAFMERRLADFREMGQAAKTLYTELTPEQQELADRLLSRRHGRRLTRF